MLLPDLPLPGRAADAAPETPVSADLTPWSGRLAGLAANLTHLTEEDDDDAVDDPIAPSSELRAVTKRISVQYIDVLARAASRLLSGERGGDVATQLSGALFNLSRLANASGDAQHHALLTQLQQAVAVWLERQEHGRGESAFRNTLHRWLHDYASFLGVDQSAAIRRLMGTDAADAPLLRRLGSLRGIGPRRLERLYAAGLHDVGRLSETDPADVAAVTGLPLALAEQVIHEARSHQERQRTTLVTEMAERVLAFVDEVRRLRASGQVEHADAIESALTALERARAELEGVA